MKVKFLTSMVILFLLGLSGCAVKTIKPLKESDFEVVTSKSDAVFFEANFIPKGSRMRVRNFEGGIRGVSVGMTSQMSPLLASENIEHVLELGSDNCLTGATIGMDTIFRNWLLSDRSVVTERLVRPTNLCFAQELVPTQ